jgi:hypothetical protein
MSFIVYFFVCCVGSCLCDELNTRAEESYCLFVCVCDYKHAQNLIYSQFCMRFGLLISFSK